MSKMNEINGLPIVDATRTIRIHISQRDAKLGKTKDPGACAAARSCIRTVDECTAARIHLSCAYLKMGAVWVRYKTSQALRSEIVAFDRGASFEPGIYTLAAVPPSQRVNNKKKRSGSNTNRNKPGKHRKLAVRHVTTNVRPHGANR